MSFKTIKLINVNSERIYSFLNFIRPFIKGLSTADIVIEIGCGSGYLASKLAEFHKNLQLIDIVDNRIYCRELSFHVVNVATTRLPFEDRSVSLIIGTQVIEHIENLTFFMNECHRILQKEGRLIVAFPNFDNINQRLRFLLKGNVVRLCGQISSGGHINFLPLKTLQYWMENKFSLEKVDGDFTASTNYLTRLVRLFSKNTDGHVVFPTIKSPLMSYNLMAVFQKKE